MSNQKNHVDPHRFLLSDDPDDDSLLDDGVATPTSTTIPGSMDISREDSNSYLLVGPRKTPKRDSSPLHRNTNPSPPSRRQSAWSEPGTPPQKRIWNLNALKKSQVPESTTTLPQQLKSDGGDNLVKLPLRVLETKSTASSAIDTGLPGIQFTSSPASDNGRAWTPRGIDVAEDDESNTDSPASSIKRQVPSVPRHFGPHNIAKSKQHGTLDRYFNFRDTSINNKDSTSVPTIDDGNRPRINVEDSSFDNANTTTTMTTTTTTTGPLLQKSVSLPTPTHRFTPVVPRSPSNQNLSPPATRKVTASHSKNKRSRNGAVRPSPSFTDDLQLRYESFSGVTVKTHQVDKLMHELDDTFGEKNYGIVEFSDASQDKNQAWFLRLKKERHKAASDGDLSPKLLNFVNKTLGYPLPRLLISVVGGALDFELPPELSRQLKIGLRRAAEATDAWIVTGGTDCGIMKYVGQAVSEIDEGMVKNNSSEGRSELRNRPLIGFSTFGVLRARQVLDEEGGSPKIDLEEHDPRNKKGPGLDNNHNVFLLYDDGTEMKFGAEIDCRAQFQSYMKETEYHELALSESQTDLTQKGRRKFSSVVFNSTVKIFSVLLVVEGGPFTFQTAQDSVRESTPVVVMEGTGRAADVLSYAWKYLHDPEPESRFLTLAGLRAKIRRIGPGVNELKLQRDALVAVQDPTQVYIHDADFSTKGKQTGLDQAMLEAIIRAQKLEMGMMVDSRDLAVRPVRQTNLYLSLIFNREDVAARVLNAMKRYAQTPANDEVKADLEKDLFSSLRWALLGGRVKFVKMLCPIVDIYKFLYGDNEKTPGSPDMKNLKVLFTKWDHLQTKPYLNQLLDKIARKQKWRTKVGSVNPMLDQLKKRSMKSSRRSGATNVRIKRMDTLTSGHDNAMDIMNEFIAYVMMTDGQEVPENFKFLGVNFDYKSVAEHTNAPKKKLERDHAYLDLLLWSILFGHSQELATYFWREGGNSTSVALFAALVLRQLSMTDVLRNFEQYKGARSQLLKMSAEFERLAIGVIEECHKTDHTWTLKILEEKPRHLRGFNNVDRCRDCMSLAMAGRRRKFLALPACLMLQSHEWNGMLSPQNRMTPLLANMFLPILLLQNYFFSIEFDKRILAMVQGKEDVQVPKAAEPGEAPYLSKVKALYSAPLVKLCLDIASHAGLLALFSSVMLSDVANSRSLGASEVLLIVWMVSLTTEELLQVLQDGFLAWFKDWNILDAIAICCYWIGLGCRIGMMVGYSHFPGLNDVGIPAGRTMFMSLSCALYYLRISRFYMANQTLGPKLIMIYKMSEDIIVYMSLFVPWMFAYGVFTESLLRSRMGDFENGVSAQSNWEILVRMFHRPAFQQYGELFLDEIMAETSCLGPTPFTNCRDGHESVALISWVYLFFVNVVLVNLLIALMGSTYDKVQQETQMLWYEGSWRLLHEYEEKAILPAPFSVIVSISQIIQETNAARVKSGHVASNLTTDKLADIGDHYRSDSRNEAVSDSDTDGMSSSDAEPFNSRGSRASRASHASNSSNPFQKRKKRLEHEAKNKQKSLRKLAATQQRDARRLESFQEKHTEIFQEKDEIRIIQLENSEVNEGITQLERHHHTYALELYSQIQRLDDRMSSMAVQTSDLTSLVGDSYTNLAGRLDGIATNYADVSFEYISRLKKIESFLMQIPESSEEEATLLNSIQTTITYLSKSAVSLDSKAKRRFTESQFGASTEISRKGGLGLGSKTNRWLNVIAGARAIPTQRFSGNYPKPEDRENCWVLKQTFFETYFNVGKFKIVYHFRDQSFGAILSNVVVAFADEVWLSKQSPSMDDAMLPYHADGSVVKRCDVPIAFRRWDALYDDYHPPHYTAPYVFFCSPDCSVPGSPNWAHGKDPNGELAKPRNSYNLMSTFFDDSEFLDPTNHHLPIRNPRGRTGLKGRGTLAKWGPNKATHYVITRCRFDNSDTQIERAGKQMFQILLWKNKEGGGNWILPGGFRRNETSDPLLDLFRRTLLWPEPEHVPLVEESMTQQEKETVEAKAAEIKAGNKKRCCKTVSELHNLMEELYGLDYSMIDQLPANKTLIDQTGEDERDTDNAWIEYEIKSIDLSKIRLNRNDEAAMMEIAPHKNATTTLEWVVMHKDLSFEYQNHATVVKAIATQCKAFF